MVVGSSVARADEPPPIPVTKVELKERPELAKTGKVAIYKGEADDQGVAFYIDGLGINTPVAVMLISGESASPMKLSLKNDLSMDWDKHVKADAGVSSLKFRTEGPATALVQSPTHDKKPYSIAIWVGPELKVHTWMKPPFVTQAEYDKDHPGGGGGGSGKTIGIVVGGVIVLVILVAVMRRKKAGAR
jgi:hypothetical protein